MSTRIYPKYAITAVGAVVLNDNKILLVKRGKEPGKSLWSIPGGAVNAGEKLKEAVLRELREETGLTGEVSDLIHVEEVIVRENNRIKYHYVILYYLVTNVKGRLKSSSDVLEAKWFDLTEAYSLENITSGTKKVLNKINCSKN